MGTIDATPTWTGISQILFMGAAQGSEPCQGEIRRACRIAAESTVTLSDIFSVYSVETFLTALSHGDAYASSAAEAVFLAVFQHLDGVAQ